jgi:hypothetical protein
MNELFYLHISWMINVLLGFLCGFTLGYLYKFIKGEQESK